MATWLEVGQQLLQIGGQQLNETMWRVDLQGCEPSRTQQVFVSYEVMKPDFEMLKVLSPVAPSSLVDVEGVVRMLGGLVVGNIGYTPTGSADGLVHIGTTIPLALLDLTSPQLFLVYLAMVAQAADGFERQLLGPVGMPDMM